MSLGKEIKCEACLAFYCFFTKKLILNSIMQGYKCSILFIMTLKLLVMEIIHKYWSEKPRFCHFVCNVVTEYVNHYQVVY